MTALKPLIWFALAALAFFAAWQFFGMVGAIGAEIEALSDPSNAEVGPLESAMVIQMALSAVALVVGFVLLFFGFRATRRRREG